MTEPPARWRVWLARGLLGGVLLIVVGGPLVAAWRGRVLAADALGPLELFAGQLLLTTFLASWFVLCERRSLRRFLALPPGDWPRRLGRGLRLGLAGWLLTVLAMAVLSVMTRAAGLAPSDDFADLVIWLATRPLGLRLALIVCAMTIEEAFFRAFLQPRIGVVGATLCFALSHLSYGSPAMGGGVFVIGLVLGLAFRRERDLMACIVAHGVFDAIQLLVILPLVATRV